jgi:hypothetical protein
MSSRTVRTLGLLLGAAGLALAVWTTADDLEGTNLPDLPALATAGVAAVVSLLAAGRSWARLVDAGTAKAEVLGALYLSQLSKYLPAGGVVQAAGQVTMSSQPSIPLARAATAFPIAALEVVVAGALLSLGLLGNDELPPWLRAACAVAPASALLLHPRALRVALTLARRVSGRVGDGSHLPDGRAVLVSSTWALLNMAATTTAFVVLADSVVPDVPLATTWSAYAAAWVVGFLVIPVPSGLGVREAVLVLAVPQIEAGALVAASVGQRLVTLVTEVAVVAGNAWYRRRAERRRCGIPQPSANVDRLSRD